MAHRLAGIERRFQTNGNWNDNDTVSSQRFIDIVQSGNSQMDEALYGLCL